MAGLKTRKNVKHELKSMKQLMKEEFRKNKKLRDTFKDIRKTKRRTIRHY